jgi:hypothetical protein
MDEPRISQHDLPVLTKAEVQMRKIILVAIALGVAFLCSMILDLGNSGRMP